MKIIVTTIAAAILLGTAGFASASTNPVPERDVRSPVHAAPRTDSYPLLSLRGCERSLIGNDACGTATGGPVGGLGS